MNNYVVEYKDGNLFRYGEIKSRSKESKIIERVLGKTFGYITPFLYKGDGTKKNGKFLCRCVCGRVVEYSSGCFSENKIYSCGCKRSGGPKSKRENKIDITTYDYGICYFLDGTYFIFDKEDVDIVKKYYWAKSSFGYAVAYYQEKDAANKRHHRMIFYHRLIMNAPKNMDVDHKYGNILDNRKENLRICQSCENDRNKGVKADNKSGVTGVCFDKYSNKWRAYITKNKQRIELGKYENIEDAIKIRKQTEIELFGDFSWTKINESTSNV